MNLKIYAALEEDAIKDGHGYSSRTFRRGGVCIVNPATKVKIHCEALQFDSNFLNCYNQSPRWTINDQRQRS